MVFSRQDEKQGGSGSAGLSVIEGPGSRLVRRFDLSKMMPSGRGNRLLQKR